MWRILYFILPLFIGGCANFTYYLDAVNGHYALLEKSRPIDSVISEDSSEDLKNKLITFQHARLFAIQELLLPDNGSYKSYADIGRVYATWNVITTEKFSIKAKESCFLFAGCLNYKGFFSKKQAEEYANKLKLAGYDTYVAGSRAYSTLGWFDDPLLNTMMYKSEANRVGILFHELAHQKIYVDDDSNFNEAFATFIEKEGVKRWLEKQDKQQELKKYYLSNKRQNEFNKLLRKARTKLQNIYALKEKEHTKVTKKEMVFVNLKKEYEQLKIKWQGYDGYDKWMEQDLNNAHLALTATYYDLVPMFNQVLLDSNNDLKNFYKKVAALSKRQE